MNISVSKQMQILKFPEIQVELTNLPILPDFPA